MSDQKIILLSEWGGAPAGTSLSLPQDVAADLIKRGIAQAEGKLSAPTKGAAKSGGKDGKK